MGNSICKNEEYSPLFLKKYLNIKSQIICVYYSRKKDKKYFIEKDLCVKIKIN